MSIGVNLFMVATAALLAIIIVVTALRALHVQCDRDYWRGWIDPRAADDERAETPPGLWWRSIRLVTQHPWLLLVPFGFEFVNLMTRWLIRWRMGVLPPWNPPQQSTAFSFESMYWLMRDEFQWPRLGYMVTYSSFVGHLVASYNLFVALPILLLGGLYILRGTNKAGLRIGWLALVLCGVAYAYGQIYLVGFPHCLPSKWGTWLMDMPTYPAVLAVSGLTVLVLLRSLAQGRRLSLASMCDEVSSAWPPWFLIQFLLLIPLYLKNATYLVVHQYCPSREPLLPMCAQVSSWLMLLTSLALRFAPYRIIASTSSAYDAAVASLNLWRTQTREVIGLLGGLWVVGFPLLLVVNILGDLCRLLPTVGSEIAAELLTVIWSAFLLLAELTCLQWYQLMLAEETSEEKISGEVGLGTA